MLRTTVLPQILRIAALALLSAAGCSDPPEPPPDVAPPVDAGDAATEAGGDVPDAEASVPACEMNLPRCEFPDGGAPESVRMQGRIQALSLCNFCHQDSTPGAGDFTGQLTPRPMTMAYGTNLSPDPDTGIGRLTDEQIARSVRCAVGREGRRLCAMAPFAATRLTNDNLCALIAYLRSLPPVRRPIPASTCSF